MRRIHEPLDALMMVGGFSGSEYLFKRVDVSVIQTPCGEKTDRPIPRIAFVINFPSLAGHPMPTRRHSGAQRSTVLPVHHWSR